MASARDRLAGLLGGVGQAGAFSARRTARPDDLRVEVRDVGPVAFPVSVRQAKQLCLVGRPAWFGRGEQTLLDRGVRDTWEVPKSRIRIDKRQWDRTLVPVLDAVRADLGLPPGCRLRAEFHAMLVYGPGQFFAPHQDSEKDDAMVGTLVVTLPSDAKGGALVVEHAGASVSYRSSKQLLSFVAFYADCRHEVRPVASGYRVVLTYNLLLSGDSTGTVASGLDPGLTEELVGCLADHFSTRVPGRYGLPDQDPPTRLVYLLDYEYTERGLSWARLKGSDAARAGAVRAAVEVSDCQVVLALAEVHETWTAEEPYSSYDDHRWNDEDEDEDAGDGSPEGVELGELIESTVHLDRWLVDRDGPAVPTSLTVSEDEVCATTPSVKLLPYTSEYEGYMGNYGNTMDRWYRRAALLVWPGRLAFAVRAEADPEWALDTLAEQIRERDVAGARERAATVASFWTGVAGGEKGGGLLTKAMRVAHGLEDADLASMLLAPFRVESLARSHAKPLVQLAAGYGEPWARGIVEVWFGRDLRRPLPGEHDRVAWIESQLPSLCRALCTTQDGAMARLLIAGSWAWLHESIRQAVHSTSPSGRHRALGEQGPATAAVLTSAGIADATDLRDEVIGVLCEENNDLLACLMPALRAAAAISPQPPSGSGLDTLAKHCVQRLDARLASPPRDRDDWSIPLPAGCTCDLCTTLGRFLGDRTRRTVEWPLAKPGRQHIHIRIEAAELPVRHETRRTGRPYTLVLTKTDVLFEREREARSRDEADLAWLNTNHRRQHNTHR
jgi:hypothetical protein